MSADLRFTLLFLLLIAVAAFIARLVISRRSDDPAIEEILTEIVPVLNDPAALHRKVARDFRKMRIRGAGTIVDITAKPGTEIVRVRDRVTVETGGVTGERDIVYELAFMHPDTLDDARVGQYVEFTGILINVMGGSGTPVLTVDPGEILHIGDGPPDAAGRSDEDAPEAEDEP
jgi:hypothetical protein